MGVLTQAIQVVTIRSSKAHFRMVKMKCAIAYNGNYSFEITQMRFYHMNSILPFETGKFCGIRVIFRDPDFATMHKGLQ